MQRLARLAIGDRFRPAEPGISLNGKTYSVSDEFTVSKIYAVVPFVRVCRDAAGAIVTFPPEMQTIGVLEPEPRPQDLSRVRQKKRKLIASVRLTWDGQAPLQWLPHRTLFAYMKLLETGRKEFSAGEIRDILDPFTRDFRFSALWTGGQYFLTNAVHVLSREGLVELRYTE